MRALVKTKAAASVAAVCVAMLAAALALPSHSSAGTAPVDQAKRAVRREVQARFPDARDIGVYSCQRLTARRFKCTWDAYAQRGQSGYKHGFAYGDARATVYQYGADARLSNIRCSSGEGPIVGLDFCAGA